MDDPKLTRAYFSQILKALTGIKESITSAVTSRASADEGAISALTEQLKRSTIEVKGDKGDRGDDGKDGRDGRDGIDGKDGIGIDGKDGRDGKDGKDGKDADPADLEKMTKEAAERAEKAIDPKLDKLKK